MVHRFDRSVSIHLASFAALVCLSLSIIQVAAQQKVPNASAQETSTKVLPVVFNGRVVPAGGVPYETLKQIVAYQAKLDGVAD